MRTRPTLQNSLEASDGHRDRRPFDRVHGHLQAAAMSRLEQALEVRITPCPLA
jgi:hypothetical protein